MLSKGNTQSKRLAYFLRVSTSVALDGNHLTDHSSCRNERGILPLSFFISQAPPYPSCKCRRELASSPCHRRVYVLFLLTTPRRSYIRECTTRFRRSVRSRSLRKCEHSNLVRRWPPTRVSLAIFS